jgi:hypothetical protein
MAVAAERSHHQPHSAPSKESHATTAPNDVDLAVRTQLEYYGAARYDLAEQFVADDDLDHEAPPGTPPGPEGSNAVLGRLREVGGVPAQRQFCARLGPSLGGQAVPRTYAIA